MSFKLRLYFLGLYALVFNPTTGFVRVLVVDARVPGCSSQGVPHLSHHPTVSFDLADLLPGVEQADYSINYNPKEQTPKGKWMLNGDDLEIRVEGKALPNQPLILDESMMNFIPTMENEIYPESGGLQVNPLCLTDIRRLTEIGLAARIQLRAGKFGVYAGGNFEYITPDAYTFTGSSNIHAQRLASCVLFETEIDANEVELFSKTLDGGLTFRPDNGANLELTIANIPCEEVAMAQSIDPEIDTDFELVYNIAATLPEQLRLPIRNRLGIEYPWPGLCLCVAYNPHQLA